MLNILDDYINIRYIFNLTQASSFLIGLLISRKISFCFLYFEFYCTLTDLCFNFFSLSYDKLVIFIYEKLRKYMWTIIQYMYVHYSSKVLRNLCYFLNWPQKYLFCTLDKRIIPSMVKNVRYDVLLYILLIWKKKHFMIKCFSS